MEIQIINAILHQHNLDEGSLILADYEIPLKKELKKEYISNLIFTNTKRNLGKLGEFQRMDGLNRFEVLVGDIFKGSNFVNKTKQIMRELIKKETLGSSTSGNYLFSLFQFKGSESYLTDEGDTEIQDIDEVRFALLKFEFQDSQYIDYKNVNGKIKPDIIIENDAGLPNKNEKVKKAVFVNNFMKNNLNYQLRVVDKESPGVAHFFTEKILNCKYKVKPRYYLNVLKNVSSEYIEELSADKILTEEESKIATNNFYNLIRQNNVVDQTKLGEFLFGSFLDNEDEIENHNRTLLDRFHEKGLTYNKFEITQDDEEKFFLNQFIYFGDQKRSYLKFSSADEQSGIVKLSDKRNPEYNKYVIQILVDEYPRNLVRKKTN